MTSPNQIPDIFDKLREHLAADPDRILMQFVREGERERYSWRRVAQEIARLAQFLLHAGIKPGERVGILLENHPVWGIVFLGIQSAGAVAVPLDTFHSPETLVRLIQHSGCRLLISSSAFAPQLEQVREMVGPSLRLLMRAKAETGEPTLESVLSEPLDHDLSLPAIERDLDDPVTIIYTSGTTGNPKGVLLTGRNIYGNLASALTLVDLCEDDHMLSILPLYHVLTLVINFLVPVYQGFKVTFLDTLDPHKVLKAFVDEEITIFVCVPQFYYAFQRRIQAELAKKSRLARAAFGLLLRVSRLSRRWLRLNSGRLFFGSIHSRLGDRFRLFGVGGARFDPGVERLLKDLGFDIIQAYGMTETAALITFTPPKGSEPGSVGRPLPGVEVAIREPGENGVGEVIVKGANVMKGYFNAPEATAAVIDNGWLRTGDSGYLSPRGFLYVAGRLKDVIVLSSGKNVYPEEIEHYYQVHSPEIKEMCVIGVEDDSSGERREKLHAVIVPDFDYLKSRHVVNTAEMIRYVVETRSQSLPAYQRVKSFQLRREPLPRTTTRKVKRFELQKQVREGVGTVPEPAPAEAAALPEGPVETTVWSLIGQVKKVPGISTEMNLELDLGFDSLERMELLSNVQETFGVHLSDEEAAGILTVAELVQAVTERAPAAGNGGHEAGLSWGEMLGGELEPADAERLKALLSRRPLVELLVFLLSRVIWLIAKVFFRLRSRGLENLPAAYPFMICPNHLSYLDALFIGSLLPYRVIRRQFFLGYSDYFQSGVFGLFARWLKVVPVDADKQLRQALRLAAEGLRRELVLCVFPEGERSIDGALKPFRKGPAILACEARVPVVPVAIGGTYEVWRRGSSRIRLHPVSVAFGKPLVPTAGESYEAFNARLFEAVKQIHEGTRTETSTKEH